MYGSVKRSFQERWYHLFPWLEYSIERDCVYCFPCRFFGVNTDRCLSYQGYSDWKHALGKIGTLTTHDSSVKHKEATLTWKQYQSTIAHDTSIANQLERGRLKTIQENREYVKYILEVILLCAQQGIALRGHREVNDSEKSTNIGNFLSLVQLHSRHIDLLRERLETGPKNASLLGHHYQNSMLSVLAESVLEYIISEVKSARYYTIIVDETKDVSKKEQLTLVLRYVLEGVVYERFVSYTYCEELNAAALTSYIYKALDSVHLDIQECVSQCYDGASVMSGAYSGVKARIQQDNPRAIYIHCHAHQLNLALVDSCRSLSHASDFFSLIESLYVFISSSVPHSLFLTKQKELGQKEITLVKLSDTRWSCRHASIKAIKTTLPALLATLEDIADESGSRAIESRGLLHQAHSFPFILSLILFEKIFSVTGNLSNLLQAEQLNYAGAAACIRATKQTLQNLRSEEKWLEIWKETVELGTKLNIAVSPIRCRRRQRLPSHLSNCTVEGPTGVTNTISEYRTLAYYATIDTLLDEMNKRFNELNLTLLQSLQALVPTSDNFLDLASLHPFLSHYSIDKDGLASELSVATTLLKETSPLSTLHHVYSHLYQVKECFPHLLQVLQIAMTIGVTSASAERSFSSLKRLKTHLRSTMSQERLNNVSLLHIERDLSNKLWHNLDDIVLKFADAHKNSRVTLK
uniref:TTF-type domain-containing protein n=1 Tax=Amphimedon queenslandica TaxID=400682 RepID=A0A1X7V0P6_AMPQE